MLLPSPLLLFVMVMMMMTIAMMGKGERQRGRIKLSLSHRIELNEVDDGETIKQLPFNSHTLQRSSSQSLVLVDGGESPFKWHFATHCHLEEGDHGLLLMEARVWDAFFEAVRRVTSFAD